MLPAPGAAGSLGANKAIVIDAVAPTVAFNSAAPNPTNTSQIPVTVMFSESVSGFTAGDITTSNGTVSNFAGSGSTYTFDLVPSGQGLVTANIAAGVAQDAAGNGNTAATQFSRTYDSSAPTVSFNSAAPNPTTTSPIPVTVNFNESVTGFTAGDITTSNGTVLNFAGSGSTYTFDLVPSGQGLVTANIAAGVAQDAAGNPNTPATQFSRTYDSVPPTVSQLVRGNASPTNAGSVTFNLLYSEPVTNATASNFTLVPGGAVTGAMITNVVCNMGVQSCVITVNTGTGSGTLGLNLTNSTGVTDSAGSGVSNLPYVGEVYTLDKDAPDTTITPPTPANPTNATAATFGFTGSDTGGAGLFGFECKLDTGNFTPCTSPQSYTGLSDGPHTFQVRAFDAAGNVDPTPATYTWLIDTTAPMLGPCQANITNQSAGASCMATVTFTPPTATDAGGTPTVTCTPASGSSFPLGITTVSCKATDAVNNMSGPCTFTVQVIDTAAPTLSACPANITAPNTTNQCSTTVSYTTPTATDNCSTPTVSCSPASGTTFNLGVTTVTCTASDASPNSPDTTCSFTVTVNDTQNPSLTCPANITLNTAAGICTAVATYATPVPTDNCAGVTATCTPASGSTFQKGVTTVTCTATDAANNMASCSFTVTVNDNQNPTITCPSNQTATSLTGNPIPLTFPAPTAADNCSGVMTACVPASGSNFAVGITTVTCTATDASNRTATCSFTVTVISCTSIACPTDVSVATTGNSATVNYSLPVPTGSCGTITCSPASGSTFNLGVTTVTCASSIGNQSCSFKVTVNRVSGSAFDPLLCTGPGNTVQATLVISNNGNVNQTVADTTTFTNLNGVPGSCAITPNVGTCVVTNGNLTYNATLTPGQTVTLTYLTQVSDLAPTGAQVCTNNSVSFNGGTPLAFSVCDVVDCPAVGPGNLIPAASEASDQKAGSVLIYNVYTSGATSGNTQNTRINITNTHLTLPSYVHLFFVAEGCAVADSYICLTGNQTASFLASDLDPGTTGYLVAVAVNALGCPTNFNSLIGDEYVKFTSGHAANLAAEAFAALPGGLPACDANANTVAINFDGVSYNRAPATLSLDNIGSRADGNDTLLIVNRIGGNLGIGAASLGTLFGIFYDDAEAALSFSVTGTCQLRNSITNNFPRITPRFETFVPAGRTGWLKIYNQTGAIGITGAAINFNPNASSSAGAFNQGHNLHHLTLNATSSYIIPVFPPSC